MRRKISLALCIVIAALWIAQPAISHAEEKEKTSEKKEHEHKASQEGHSHKAPHGGMVITVDKYHYEMAVEPDTLRVYLLDEKEQTLPISEVTGNAIIHIPGQKPQTVTLTASRDHLSATVNLEGAEKFVALVSLKIDGKTRVGRFSYQKPEEHKEKGHEEGHHKEGDHREEGHHH